MWVFTIGDWLVIGVMIITFIFIITCLTRKDKHDIIKDEEIRPEDMDVINPSVPPRRPTDGITMEELEARHISNRDMLSVRDNPYRALGVGYYEHQNARDRGIARARDRVNSEIREHSDRVTASDVRHANDMVSMYGANSAIGYRARGHRHRVYPIDGESILSEAVHYNQGTRRHEIGSNDTSGNAPRRFFSRYHMSKNVFESFLIAYNDVNIPINRNYCLMKFLGSLDNVYLMRDFKVLAKCKGKCAVRFKFEAFVKGTSYE